ncbi:MAG: phenylalanine--tRNA ligase subunit beta [Chitinophagaceae bacterium]|nr:phenylalanine--tRNA ligase subunit beta [Chitinophagaceae bacterium]
MTISYNWLSEYLPVTLEPDRLSNILTSIGLEVESLEKYEEVKGGLKGLLIAEVMETKVHPNADKLTLTTINTGNSQPIQIVCGAPNVAVGQKVIVAPVGATIYPRSAEPITMKLAKIRGEESFGMICAEDEIGLGDSHEGIMVLSPDAKPGTLVSDYFNPYVDYIFEIGITPNRMDAMSHLGVARDVCAYLSFHEKKEFKVKWPYKGNFKADDINTVIQVIVENKTDCPRYSGILISNVEIGESPKWLKQRLRSIGIRPVNNIVDITNFIQHETGQPLHAFDADKITGQTIVVKNLPDQTIFKTLDEKVRKLSANDLMICNSDEPMCIAGVFGGLNSGVTNTTKNIFIESAFFNPVSIRKTSFRHVLRTDAATRFEKGVDISNTVTVLKRTALLIKEINKEAILAGIIDIYPHPEPKKEIDLKFHYLKKLSGKSYHPDAVKNILQSLEFEILKERIDEIWVAPPFHKPDINIPADLVEEILRIDGLDNVDIKGNITISPSMEENFTKEKYREKVSDYLAGSGFNQIITNSITNSVYYSEPELKTSVRLLNNLSEELNVMRLSLLETGLETIAYNLNRKNENLLLFEFGKTYNTETTGNYVETEHLLLLSTGKVNDLSWRIKQQPADYYYLKGVSDNILSMTGIDIDTVSSTETLRGPVLKGFINRKEVLSMGQVTKTILSKYEIKQPVFYLDFNWDLIMNHIQDKTIRYQEISKYPAMHRDLALVVNSSLPFTDIEKSLQKLQLPHLQSFHLFDVFENEKIGANKKSLAISFTFIDKEKTLTDKEIDGWMQKLINVLEKDVSAEIRN